MSRPPISDLDARPWDFQAEECSLRACVDRFNNRRYLAGNVLRSGGNGNGAGGTGGPNNSGNGAANDLNEYGDPTNPLDPLNAGGVGLLGGLVGGGFGGAGCGFGGNGGGQVYAPGYGGWDTEPVELTEEFKQQYEEWLQQEVFQHQINWDSLITGVEY